MRIPTYLTKAVAKDEVAPNARFFKPEHLLDEEGRLEYWEDNRDQMIQNAVALLGSRKFAVKLVEQMKESVLASPEPPETLQLTLEFIRDHSKEIFENLCQENDWGPLRFLAGLSEEEFRIALLQLVSKLADEKPLTPEEIADFLQVDPDYVRAMQASGLEKIRETLLHVSLPYYTTKHTQIEEEAIIQEGEE